MRCSRVSLAFLLALVLSATAAGQALGAEWAIGEKPLTVLGISKAPVTTAGEGLKISAPELELTIACTSQTGSGEIIAGEGATGNLSMTLKGCGVEKSEVCSVMSAEQSSGTIVIGEGTEFLAIESEGDEHAYEKLAVSTTLEFTGIFCPLPKELALKGTSAAQVPLLEEEAEERPLEFSQEIAEASGVEGLQLGEEAAYLVGNATETLSGEYEGEQATITSVAVEPDPVEFGGVESLGVVLKNTGPLKLEYTEIKISEGPFTRTDSAPCKGSKFFAEELCTIAVKCNTASNTGKLEIRWDILSMNDELKGFNRRFVDLICE